jgi:hypothetical protein
VDEAEYGNDDYRAKAMPSREWEEKRLPEDVAEQVSGVSRVQNSLRITRQGGLKDSQRSDESRFRAR